MWNPRGISNKFRQNFSPEIYDNENFIYIPRYDKLAKKLVHEILFTKFYHHTDCNNI